MGSVPHVLVSIIIILNFLAFKEKKLLVSHQKKQTWPSGPVNSVSIASRVVPLMGLTIVLSSPTSAFKMLLLPTFGLPTIEIAGT